MKKLAMALAGCMILGSVPAPAASSTASPGVTLIRPVYEAVRGSTGLLNAVLSNAGPDSLFLNGIQSDLPSAFGADSAADPFFTSTPIALASGEVWIGPVLRIFTPANADSGTFDYSFRILSGGSAYDTAATSPTWFRLDVEGPGGVAGAPPLVRSQGLELAVSPNPFGEVAEIRVQFGSRREIAVQVFDVSGRRVRTLYRGDTGVARRVFRWNGRDDAGRSVRGGTYFIELSSGADRLVRKVVRVR